MCLLTYVLDNSLFQKPVSPVRSLERMMQLGVLSIKLGSMQRHNSTQRTERTAGSGRVVMQTANGKASGKGRPKRSRPSAFSKSSIRRGRDRPGVDSKVSHKTTDPKRYAPFRPGSARPSRLGRGMPVPGSRPCKNGQRPASVANQRRHRCELRKEICGYG